MGEDGRSGAALQRATLADGRQVVVKRYDARTDVVMQVCGDERGREVEIFLAGLLDDLPPTVRHSILAAWYDDDGRGVVVMRDLGDAVLTWEDRLSPAQTRRVLEALADLHTAYLDREVVAPTTLDAVVGIFEPDRLQSVRGRRPGGRCVAGVGVLRGGRARRGGPTGAGPGPRRGTRWCGRSARDRRPCCTATCRR